MSEPSRRALLGGALGAVGLALASCAQRGDPAAGAVSTDGAAQPPRASAPRPRAVGLEHGTRERPEVAITLHGDGDPALVDRFLQVCQSAGVPVTVFAVGQWLAAHPTLTKRVLDGGHELANHTWSGAPTAGQDRNALRAEVLACRAVLLRQTGSPGSAFRPVLLRRATPLVLEEARAAGYAHVVTEDVDPADAAGASADQIAARVTSWTHAGSVLSLTPRLPTVQAMPAVLDLLARERLRPVPVSRLLRPLGT